MTPINRITAAVELNPDRSRVTVRRDDARALLAAVQQLTRERDGFKVLADQRRLTALGMINPLSLMPHAWMLYGLSAVAGVLVGRG